MTCINIIQTREILDRLFFDANISKSMNLICDSCQRWEDSVSILSYFLCIVLLQYKDDGIDACDLIEKIYERFENSAFIIEELGEDFIAFLMGSSNEFSTFEESLVELQNRFGEYNYDSIICC